MRYISIQHQLSYLPVEVTQKLIPIPTLKERL
jgi:hypothetical protein